MALIWRASTTTTELTQIELVEETGTRGGVFPLPDADPYPSKTPKHMLEREYLLTTISSSTLTLTSFRPLDLLLAVPTIQNYLKNFRFIRSGFQLRFVMVSAPTQYGVISVSQLPYVLAADTVGTVNISQLSQAGQALMDVSSQESYSLHLPYVSPKNYVDLAGNVAAQPSWRVDVKTLAMGTTVTGASTSVAIQVFGSFVDVETAGYLTNGAVFQSSAPNRWGFWDTVASATSSVLRNAKTFSGAVTAGAGVATSGRYIYNTVTGGVESEGPAPDPLAEVTPMAVRSQIAPDLSSPGTKTILSRLGDNISPQYVNLPNLDNPDDLVEIMRRPTLIGVESLPSVQPIDLEMHPYYPGTYLDYLLPMFKYFRGSFRLMIKFFTSPMVSGRIKISLFPAQLPMEATPSYGDIPQWIVSVKGSETFCIEVPYLQLTPWVVGEGDVIFPTVRVELASPLPKPFDKDPSIFCLFYIGAGSDFEVAGLQSFLPEPTFQCDVLRDFQNCERIGMTQPYPFQGKVSRVQQAIGRYSTRVGSPQNVFPFPILINSWNKAAELDNFDWVSNLFAFFTGNVNVRLLFNGSVPGSLLRVGIQNSNSSSTIVSAQWRSSNSIAITDQTIWPMLEYEYPYLNRSEYDSLLHPSGMFSQKLENIDKLENMFLCAGENFRLMHLMPVPNFYFSAKPAPPPALMQADVAVFQSVVVPRTLYPIVRFNSFVSVASGWTSKLVMTPFNFTSSFVLDSSITVKRVTGTVNATFGAFFSMSATPPAATDGTTLVNCIAGAVGDWVDQANNGSYAVTINPGGSFARADPAATAGNLYLHFWCNFPVTMSVVAVTNIQPYSSLACLSSPQTSGDTVGFVNSNVVGSTGSLSVAVVNQPSVTTLAGSVVNSTLVSPATVPVSIAGTVNVTGSVSSTIADPVKVHGYAGSDVPVWTSAYKTL
jgi:hypothetical protein